MKLNVGDIYEIDTRNAPGPNQPYGGILMTQRILAFDAVYAFADGKLLGNNYWSLDKEHKKRYRFGKIPVSILEQYGKLIGHEDIPDTVLASIQPDLLLAFCRVPKLSWTNDCFNNRQMLHDWIKMFVSEKERAVILETDKIYLEPWTKGKFPKTPILIEADNGQYFTFEEVLWKAKSIREAINKMPSDGVGIFRSGGKKRIPTFYIWEYCNLTKTYCKLDK
jgi:hypothetical protein